MEFQGCRIRLSHVLRLKCLQHLNSLQHPLYDVWVIKCMTSTPGQAPAVVATAPVKPVSPNAGANEAMPTLPEDAGQ